MEVAGLLGEAVDGLRLLQHLLVVRVRHRILAAHVTHFRRHRLLVLPLRVRGEVGRGLDDARVGPLAGCAVGGAGAALGGGRGRAAIGQDVARGLDIGLLARR